MNKWYKQLTAKAFVYRHCFASRFHWKFTTNNITWFRVNSSNFTFHICNVYNITWTLRLCSKTVVKIENWIVFSFTSMRRNNISYIVWNWSWCEKEIRSSISLKKAHDIANFVFIVFILIIIVVDRHILDRNAIYFVFLSCRCVFLKQIQLTNKHLR